MGLNINPTLACLPYKYLKFRDILDGKAAHFEADFMSLYSIYKFVILLLNATIMFTCRWHDTTRHKGKICLALRLGDD